MLCLRKRFDDYETMGEVSRDFKTELLEITQVEKLLQIYWITLPKNIRWNGIGLGSIPEQASRKWN